MSSELRALLADEAMRHGGKRKANGNIEFKCNRHSDKKASAWLGDRAHGCLACGFTESLITLAEEWGVPVPGSDYTLEDYAAEKGFDIEKLREWGLITHEQEGGSVVGIPYHDESGELSRWKYRGGDKKMWWDEATKGSGLQLYGMDRLNGSKSVIVVEGESDTHAAWHHDVPVVGVPGANAWKREWRERLVGKRVYIWKEPDQGGEAFVRALARDFPDARIIEAPAGVKDMADLHLKVGERFKEELQRMAQEAVPVGAPKLNIPFDVMLGENMRALLERKLKPIDAVPTPFPSWSKVCRGEGGWQGIARGWHVLGAAVSGGGKSVLGCNLAWQAAVSGERATYITLEMSQPEIQTRLMSVMSGVPIRTIEQGPYFSVDAFNEAARRVNEIHEQYGGCVAINRAPIRSLRDILDSIRYNFEVHGSRFFVVDYLQLASVGKTADLYSRICEVSDSVRALVKDLEVAEVGMSQFNRETSKTGDRPRKEGLKGGADLEQDAEQVILLHRSDDDLDNVDQMFLTAIIDKNRHGPKTDIPIRFDKSTLRLTERLPDEMASYRVS